MSSYEKVIVTDSRLLQRRVLLPRLQGAADILYKQWNAAAVSNSGFQFTCPTPQSGLEIDRQIMLLTPVRLTLSMEDVPAGSYLLNPNLCNIRSYPIQKAASSIRLTLNNNTVSIAIGDILSALENFNTSPILKNLEYSTTATYGCGQSQKFNNLPEGSRSELSVYINSICGIAPQAFPFTIVSATTPVGPSAGTATAVVDFVSCENLFISPLYWGNADDNVQAFVGIETLNMDIEFQNNSGFRMIAIDNADLTIPLGSGAITVSTQFHFQNSDNFTYADKTPKLLMQYIRPQIQLPKGTKSAYSYYQVDQFKSTHTAAIAAAAQDVIVSKEITLPRLPSKIFVFARKPSSVFLENPFTPDCFMGIENLSIIWNTRNCLSSAHKTQLYQISVKNGVQMDYTSWSGLGINNAQSAALGFGTAAQQFGGTGSLVCVDPLDLGLSDDMSQYPEHQISIQVNATVKNIATDSFVPELFVVTLSDGILEIADGIVSTRLGVTDTVIPDAIKGKQGELVSTRKAGYLGGAQVAMSLKNLFKRRIAK